MTGGFSAGSIVGALVLDKTKWTQSVTDVKKDTKAMKGMSDKMAGGFRAAGKAMTVAGGAIVGALGMMVKKYVEVGDWVDKMSKRTGFAATTLSELAYAADISGANLGDVEKAVKRMARTIIDAGSGLETYVRAFRRIGIEVKDLDGLNPEEQFLKIGEAIASVEDPTLRAAAAQEIFGRAGTTLLPLFAEGKEGMKALREEAHELGIIFDTEAAAKAAKLKDAQTALKASFQGLGFALADSLVPVLTKFVGKITETMTKVIAWTKEHPKLTETIVKLTAGIGALMLVLGPLAIMLPGLITMFGALTGPVGLVTAALVLLGAKALQAGKDFKTSMDLYQKESELTGEKVGWLEKTLNSARAAWDKLSYGVDTNKIAMQAYTEAQRKAKGVMSIATGVTKVLSGGVKFLGEKWQELADLLPGVEEEESGVNEKLTRTYEIAETAAINIGILTSSMEDFQLVTVDTKTVLDNLAPVMTRVWEEAIPPARDFSGVLDKVPTKFEDIEDASEETGTAVKSKWEDVADGIRTNWTENLSDILQGTKSLTDGLKDIFGHIKDMFFDMVAQMVTKWIFDGVSSLVSGATTAASGISASFAKVGPAIAGIGEGIGRIIIGLAEGIAGAAKIIAKAAPQILLAAAVALAIYAGFKVISSLFAKSGGAKDHMKDISDNTKRIWDVLFIDFKVEIHLLQNLVAGLYGKLDTTIAVLRKILKKSKGVSAQAGFYSPSLPSDTTFSAHQGEAVRITPAGHTRHGDMTFQFNITAGDSRDMERWARNEGIRMFQDILRQNLGGNAEKMEADLARYRRY